jgi:Beta-lactamase class C and other penicillin binding proteins
MAQVMKDWNAPGIGVGIVVKDKLVFAKGYGFRDYGKQVPYTPTTTQPIASNSKLFTPSLRVARRRGQAPWDEPIKRFVPGIRFYNDELDRSVTIRDMLSHRTGITRHDSIWYKSTFTRRELWDRLRYLEPAAPIRTTFLYNNLMYTAAGQVIEEVSGLTVGAVRQAPDLRSARMSRSTLTIEDNIKGPSRRCRSPSAATVRNSTGSRTTRRRSPLRRPARLTPRAGPVPMGHRAAQQRHRRWKAGDPQCGDPETMSPSLAMPNATLESRGWGENLNQYYGMGRWISSYRGHLLALHGGDLLDFTRRSRSCPTIPSA